MKKLITIFAILTLISVPVIVLTGFWDWLTPLFNIEQEEWNKIKNNLSDYFI